MEKSLNFVMRRIRFGKNIRTQFCTMLNRSVTDMVCRKIIGWEIQFGEMSQAGRRKERLFVQASAEVLEGRGITQSSSRVLETGLGNSNTG